VPRFEGNLEAIRERAALSTLQFARDRFHREAQAASALNHPGICTVYDVGEENGCAFIAMEFLEGSPLDRVIASTASTASRFNRSTVPRRVR
jgi:serine/threonine protein kinase